MSTHTQHNQNKSIYFITFTCHRWKPLFEESGAYYSVYNWFDYLLKHKIKIAGYIIMPNHFHGLIFPDNNGKSNLNTLVANGKRFIAYEIVKQLSLKKNYKLLARLSYDVTEKERNKGKKHKVFRISFDAFYCENRMVVEQKLDYIHHNPVTKSWRLVDDFSAYQHSSAAFYEKDEPNRYITHYMELIG